MKIWKCCKILFMLGPLERRDAYDILSLYLSFPSPIDEENDLDVGGGEESFDLRRDNLFWDEMKRGLVNGQFFNLFLSSLFIIEMYLIVEYAFSNSIMFVCYSFSS